MAVVLIMTCAYICFWMTKFEKETDADPPGKRELTVQCTDYMSDHICMMMLFLTLSKE